MTRPKLLDLFCGAGGAAMGYYRAGFDVVGVDIKPQKHFPFPLILGDALDILERMLKGEKFLASDGKWYGLDDFDAIHTSPPCQGFTKCRRIRNYSHPNHINSLRDLLKRGDKPYIIENVLGAPLQDPIMLAGTMFGLSTMRKRLFECSFEIPFFLIPPIHARHAKMGRLAAPGEFIHVAGKGGKRGVKEQWESALEIDWMTVMELAQAIPPAYTEFIGKHLMQALQVTS